MRETREKTKTCLYVFVAVVLASSIVLAVVLSSPFKPAVSDSGQESSQQQETSPNTRNGSSDEPASSPDIDLGNGLPYVVSVDNSTNHIPVDVGNNNADGTGSLPSGNKSRPANYTLSEQEAIDLAMPYIQEYASGHNRTIRGIYTYFNNDTRDHVGLRGNVSQTYPSWWILASYTGVVDRNNPETWIVGYSVSIWADIGEVYSANPQGYM